MRLSVKCGLLAVVVALAGCSMLEGDKIDYKSAQKGPSLEVPPDLTQLNRESRYVVPGGPVSANSYSLGQSVPTLPTAATAVGDVRIERSGNQRWLVVNRPADQLWGPIRDFWQENGFLLELDQPNLGIMETDWAENRAKIPQDMIRNALGKVLDSLYSTSERDRFRTRLERTPNGGTEIYITHRGMEEVYTDARKDSTVWQPRPADPELEAEFLRRLMVQLGVPQEQAKNLVASGAVPTTSRVAQVGGQPVVQIDEPFDRAWRRVGLTLDRTGFTVVDRDRSQGFYFVRYVEPDATKKEDGLFSRLFSKNEPVAPIRYRIAVKAEGKGTVLSVQNANGAPESSANAQRIVKIIADDLK